MAYLEAIAKHTSQCKLIFISKKNEQQADAVLRHIYIMSEYSSADGQWFLHV